MQPRHSAGFFNSAKETPAKTIALEKEIPNTPEQVELIWLFLQRIANRPSIPPHGGFLIQRSSGPAILNSDTKHPNIHTLDVELFEHLKPSRTAYASFQVLPLSTIYK